MDKKTKNLNIAGLHTINAKIKLSGGAAKARLFIKTGAGWVWSDSGAPLTVDSKGYTTLSISLPSAAEAEAEAEAEGVDLTAVKTIGIKLEGITNGEGTAKLYLQEVMLAAAGLDID
ncbi:hypothetical protein NSS79_05515 [Paenibacillus sp. FSL L8-0436]|uniref:hypothetical protein n=1 Tax=Paenibacillus sp. FSL L8-0436 TaxID=2954686 RepID=UPI003158D596